MLLVAIASAFVPSAFATTSADYEAYSDPYFGITVDVPTEWYIEGDNPWDHAHINPWHLPLVPIKELQPTAVDILPESRKTLITNVEPVDGSVYLRLSVEKMPFGTTLDGYVDHTVARLEKNNEGLRVDEASSTTLDGNPAVRLAITTGSKDDSFQTVHMISLYGNLAYILQYGGAAGGDYDANLAAFDRMAESADINPPASYGQALLLPMAAAAAGSAAVIAVKARRKGSYTFRFLRETKKMLPSALGIEILCVASAEAGGLLGLYYFGFNALGITMAYVLAYALAGFVTFASILGRRSGAHGGRSHEEDDDIICGCGGPHQDGFASNLKQTFANFAAGLPRMARLYREPGAWRVVKASLIVLVSAESGCIVAAATVDVMLYQYSTFLSIPAALLAGTLAVAAIAARRSLRRKFVEEKQPS